MYETEVRHTNNSPGASPSSLSGGHRGVHAEGLGKQFGDMWALRNLDLDVAPGSVLGLLGHNGAGKTTAIRMLTTLSTPTEGRAVVAGYDVVTQAGDVRKRIGVASQQATVDPLLSGRLNLELIGRLNHIPKRDARKRADELLVRLDLADAGGKLVKSYSGGMRRRLDLAACLVASPTVLFLDEPTTGLDPRSRDDLWQMLRELVATGTTLILTTQYLEEADRLADRIVLLDHGTTVADGSPSELKSRIGGDRIEVKVTDASDVVAAAGVIVQYATGEPSIDGEHRTVTAPVPNDFRLIDVVRALDEAGVEVDSIQVESPSLDDVFLAVTGERLEGAAE
jgi:ABC-2 type transport system ATP-binding protein